MWGRAASLLMAAAAEDNTQLEVEVEVEDVEEDTEEAPLTPPDEPRFIDVQPLRPAPCAS